MGLVFFLAQFAHTQTLKQILANVSTSVREPLPVNDMSQNVFDIILCHTIFRSQSLTYVSSPLLPHLKCLLIRLRLVGIAFDRVDLTQNRGHKHTVRKETNYYQTDDIDRLLKTADISQQLEYRVDLSVVYVVSSIIPQVHSDVIAVTFFVLVVVGSLVLDHCEIKRFLLTELE